MATLTVDAPPMCDCCCKRPRLGLGETYCLDCEIRTVEDDINAAEATLAVLRASFKGALIRIAPADIHRCLDEAVRETGCDGAATTDQLAHRRRELAQRLATSSGA